MFIKWSSMPHNRFLNKATLRLFIIQWSSIFTILSFNPFTVSCLTISHMCCCNFPTTAAPVLIVIEHVVDGVAGFSGCYWKWKLIHELCIYRVLGVHLFHTLQPVGWILRQSRACFFFFFRKLPLLINATNCQVSPWLMHAHKSKLS